MAINWKRATVSRAEDGVQYEHRPLVPCGATTVMSNLTTSVEGPNVDSHRRRPETLCPRALYKEKKILLREES